MTKAKLLCMLLHHSFIYAGTMRSNGNRYRCYICSRCGKRQTSLM